MCMHGMPLRILGLNGPVTSTKLSEIFGKDTAEGHDWEEGFERLHPAPCGHRSFP